MSNPETKSKPRSGFVDRLVRRMLCAYWSQRKNYYLAIPAKDRDQAMVNQLAVAELCLEHAKQGSSALSVHLRAAWRDTATQLGRFRKMMRDLFLPNDQRQESEGFPARAGSQISASSEKSEAHE